jgi:hypothetical protein
VTDPRTIEKYLKPLAEYDIIKDTGKGSQFAFIYALEEQRLLLSIHTLLQLNVSFHPLFP